MGELRFQYPSEWEETREGRATKDFFFHSDWKPEILRFLDFLQRSSKGSIYWDFV